MTHSRGHAKAGSFHIDFYFTSVLIPLLAQSRLKLACPRSFPTDQQMLSVCIKKAPIYYPDRGSQMKRNVFFTPPPPKALSKCTTVPIVPQPKREVQPAFSLSANTWVCCTIVCIHRAAQPSRQASGRTGEREVLLK